MHAATNLTCSMPFHVLLTKAILCNGGTNDLVRIINRVGVAASLDTANRLCTDMVIKRQQKGIVRELNPKALAIASIDNIDILQPHATVSTTDAIRSWHGTSVQAVQPRPSFNELSSDERLHPVHTRNTHPHPQYPLPYHSKDPNEDEEH